MPRDTTRLNNDERRQWIENDEGLYLWFRSERRPMREFIRTNRAQIDKAIRNVTGGLKQPHYLAYGR